ncbi:MAG: chromosome segregation protein SMC, partial [Caldilineae bacterium]
MLRIKRVVIQGFKTFARKTEFVFDPGVTAIVGPNGSGKSNVADAVRWCLGEQAFSLLRSKKSADVIFAGSDKRARMGMAAVSLTLDNSDGELPIDFTEVEITRRAYRDGDNEYLINGQRVRLQDITELLATSGLGKRTYAVIGQGLIDRVLSLKPEERRALFEEAAGITGHQAKRATALRRLDATQQNLERVQDIIAELAPRLRYLRRQAERAKEREQIENDLHGLLRQWYGYRWHKTLEELSLARTRAEEAARIARLRRERLDEVSARIEELRQAQVALRDQLGAQHAVSSERHRRAEELGRALAVAQERRRQLERRSEELERELADLHREQESVQARLAALREEVAAAQTRWQQRQAEAERLQTQVQAQQRTRRGLVDQLESLRGQQRKLAERIADRRSRLQQTAERRQALRDELAKLENEGRTSDATLAASTEALAQAEAEAARRTQALAQLEAEIQQATGRLKELQERLAEADARRLDAERTVDRLQTRLDVLTRLRNEGAGYASGVRTVLQAAAQGQLSGVVGTVASQLATPPHLDRAIETALGGAIQNVITESWDAAQAAIEYLKTARRGRATFLPLDRIYPGPAIPAPKAPGILGNAAELVTYPTALASVAQLLLGRVWVAENLPAARRALDQHSGSRPTVVTLDGEIIRPGGAVTGGSDNRRQDESVLAREREHRELPGQIEQARNAAASAQQASAALRRELAHEETALEQIRNQQEELRRQVRAAHQAVEQARIAQAQAQERAAWHSQRRAQFLAEEERLAAQAVELEQELAAASAEQERLTAALAEAEEAASAVTVDALLTELADRRAVAAEAQAHLASRRELLTAQERTAASLTDQINSKSQRLENLRREAEALDEQIRQQTAVETQLSQELTGLQRTIEPLESELARLQKEQSEAEAEERHLQHLLRQDESQWNAAQLHLQRTEDRLDGLRRDIRQDFGLADMEEQSEDLAYQPPLPFSAVVAQLPVVTELPPGLDAEVRETRAHLRRLSNVNPEAPKEYAEAAERHGFLVQQSEDLEKAAADLRRVIRELDQRMETELRRTFDAVAVEFVRFFRLLFNGGTAQLVMTDPEDVINTGVEIIARPPGKRPQSLELLSGGERSLTASALIFAILRVSPTPFCILDEVDAALDEANVDRFRAVLEGLGDHTQFIVITHNRRTLETANTIYGITMGDDGVSRVISLRLDGDE